jgi:hypothetical protein
VRKKELVQSVVRVPTTLTITRKTMKTTIEFNLPEDAEDLQFALKGLDMYCILQEVVDVKIRGKLRYGNLSEETITVLEELRSYIYEEIQSRKIPGFP